MEIVNVLRRFLAPYLATNPPLNPRQHHAITAITTCRTPMRGGDRYHCVACGQTHILWRSCNNKACPQCGADATARWVKRELGKRIGAPYFMVTFTLPEELRGLFFGEGAKDGFDLFFEVVHKALKEGLARRGGAKKTRGPGFAISGATAVLHTSNQKLLFHPHIHCLVPGAGLDERGRVVSVKNPKFLTRIEPLAGLFRSTFREAMRRRGWQCDPRVWRKEWGVHIQACGSGAVAVKYLGRYVARGVIAQRRIAHSDIETVTIRWENRDKGGRQELLTVPGVEFVRRYLRHVLPGGLRAVRYFGYCHPTAKKTRDKIKLATGLPLIIGKTENRAPYDKAVSARLDARDCPKCRTRMLRDELQPELLEICKAAWLQSLKPRPP